MRLIALFFILGILASSSYAEDCVGTGPDVDNFVGTLVDQDGNPLPGYNLQVYLCVQGDSFSDDSCNLKSSVITSSESGFEGFYQIDIDGVVGCDEGKPIYFVVGQEIIDTVQWNGSRMSEGDDQLISFVEPVNPGPVSSGGSSGGGSGGGGGGARGLPTIKECVAKFSCRNVGSCVDGKQVQMCDDNACGKESYELSIDCKLESKKVVPDKESPISPTGKAGGNIPEKFRDLMTGRFLYDDLKGDKDTFFIALIMIILIAVTAYFYYQEQESYLKEL